LVGSGYAENVQDHVWWYEVSGKQVLLHWFSYRKANRARPIIGDRRPPSPLSDIRPNHWLAEYTTELINVLNVCAGPTFSAEDLCAAGASETYNEPKRRANK
jgi:Type ISP C-terminal specificity domain